MSTRPNLLVLLSDQHNPAFMGCAGHPFIRTPHMDRLAREGMRFSDAYCAAPLCGPSRMSFMTGRYPSANRCWSNGQVLSSAIPTFAHGLGAAGYETALIGRMDFRGPDQRHGFELRPFADQHARHPGAPRPGGELDGRYKSESDPRARDGDRMVGVGTTHRHAFDERVAEVTCAYLAEKAHGSGQPFAAVAGFWLPHPPLIAPRDLYEHYLKQTAALEMPPDDDARQPASIRRFRADCGFTERLAPEVWRKTLAAYCALTEFLDQQIGRVLACLDETGLSRNTLVLYTSDHGHCTGEHGCYGKSTYYQGSVGVPLLARLPGVTPAGAESRAVCNLVDIGPTLLDLAGAKPLKHAAGRSLAPWLKGEQPEWTQETFSEVVDKKTGLPSAMVRSGRWKLWTYAGGLPPALFNLEADPAEESDLGAAPQHAALREELLAKIHAWWEPERIARENAEQNDNVDALKRWGKAVKPTHPDAVPPFPPEVESDVEFV